jgi:ribosomal protein S7
VVKRYRDITEKYRTFRLQPDAIYQSRLIQTLFNKFTKQGKKTLARRHVHTALKIFRFQLRRPGTYSTLLRILRSLRLQFILIAIRRGKQILDVPTPIRRNKRDIMNIQTFYNAVKRRRERTLPERLEQEFITLTLDAEHSPTLRQRNLYLLKTYEERANIDKRWR